MYEERFDESHFQKLQGKRLNLEKKSGGGGGGEVLHGLGTPLPDSKRVKIF